MMVKTVSNLIEPPLVLDAPEKAQWHDTADVVVVGFGGAGACASLEARGIGADVLAIDRFGAGGATAYSGGVFYAGETRFQKAVGIEDSKQEMYKYLEKELADVIRPDTLKRYCDNSADDLEWLAAFGVPLGGDVFLEKTGYPPEGKFLYFSGNENVPEYKAIAKAAPRGHRTRGVGFSGYAYYDAISASAARDGVRRMDHTRAMRLVTDRAGVVIGVEALEITDEKQCVEHARQTKKVHPMRAFMAKTVDRAGARARELEERHGRRVLLRATKGVILSAGGFGYNEDLLKRHLPIYGNNWRALVRMGTLGCDGSGISLGMSAGGATAYMDSVFAGRILSPPAGLLKGILLNRKAERFCNEEIYLGYLGRSIGEQPEGTAYLILDETQYKTVLKQCFRMRGADFRWFALPTLANIFLGGTKKARSLQALAAQLNMPAEALIQNVNDYNGAQQSGASDPLSKKSRSPIVKPPFRALNMSIGNKYGSTMMFTLGGLKVDEDTGNVLRHDGTPIVGLYAAGRTAAGLCAIGYFSGVSLSDGVFSGRRAGGDAATRNLQSSVVRNSSSAVPTLATGAGRNQ